MSQPNTSPPVSIIVAVAQNHVIGANGQLPWHQSADLRRFKDLTTAHPIVMGRKTYESVGKPLPNRTNIVVSRTPGYAPQGVLVADSLEGALELARNDDMGGPDREVFICGGAALYEMAIPLASRFYLTVIHADVEGETTMPQWDESDWIVTATERFPADERNDHDYTFTVLERK